jgi:hypothetical protein
VITTDIVERTLRLKQEASLELNKIETCHLDIFNLEHVTAGNELVAVTSYIIAKENIFQSQNISYDTFLSFMKRI